METHSGFWFDVAILSWLVIILVIMVKDELAYRKHRKKCKYFNGRSS